MKRIKKICFNDNLVFKFTKMGNITINLLNAKD